MKILSALSSLALVLALSTSCKKEEKTDDKKDGKETTDSKVTDNKNTDGDGAGRTKTPDGTKAKDPAGDKGPKVTLVQAGNDPKQKLRFKFNKGDKAKAELRLAMDMRMSIGGQAPPKVNLPVMRSVLEIEVSDVKENEYTFNWNILEYDAENTPGVMAPVMAEMKKQLKQLVGAKGTGKIDSRGINLGATFEMPPGVSAQVAQMMDGMRDALAKMSAPLPEEEIGVGGAWKVEQEMVQNGMTTNVTYVYTVTALTPESVTVKTELKMAGVPGKVVNNMLPPGASMNLDSMTGTGGGSMTIAFNNLVPVKSDVDMTSDTKATIKAAGTTQKTDTHMKLKIEMKKL